MARRFGRAVTLAAAIGLTLLSAEHTQDAVANGDDRTITILHEHTKESATITFRRNGSYVPEALKQLSWLLRDWRLDEPIRMDPRLFDIVWQVYREVGSQEPIHVVSGYRSPQTNAALRRRSRAVAEHSQHMLGKAMDFFLPDVPMSRVRELGMRLQRGGVGFYPNAFNPFVHLDAGGVRSWPRMPREQLARLFPDGKTVHMPRDGKPMPGYENAKEMILARGGSVPGYGSYAEADDTAPRKSLWATLFGGGQDDEDSDFYASAASRSPPARTAAASPAASGGGLFSWGSATDATPAPAPATASTPAATTAPSALYGRDGNDPLAPPARPGSEVKMVAAVPMPPRRPAELAALLAEAPLPPMRPVETAMAGSAPLVAPAIAGEMRTSIPDSVPDPSPVAEDQGSPGEADRTSLRALFAFAATQTGPVSATVSTSRVRPTPIVELTELAAPSPRIRMAFTSARLGEPDPGAFTGAAIVRLPVLP